MKVFIGCSASDKINEKYLSMTERVTVRLAELGYKLVFGACQRSMMGICYNVFSKEDMVAVSNVEYADTLRDLACVNKHMEGNAILRTNRIFEESVAYLILPGGIGTMAELFGIYDALRTAKSDEKIIVFNYDNFYKEIIDFLHKAADQRFIDDNIFSCLKIINDEESLLDYMERLYEKN